MDKFNNLFENYYNEQNADNLHSLIDYVLESKYTQKDLGISSRVLQYWNKKGLVPYEKIDFTNHRFNLFELFWLWIIEDLRRIGYPVKLIIRAKETLMEEFNLYEDLLNLPFDELLALMNDMYHFDININQLSEQELDKIRKMVVEQGKNKLSIKLPNISKVVFDFLYTRRDYLFLFNNEGEVVSIPRDDYSIGDQEGLFSEIFIAIPIIRYFSRLMDNPRYISVLAQINFLDKNEQHLLKLLQEGDVQSVTFHNKGRKKPILVEISKLEKIDKNARIYEIMARKAHESISIQTADGNITFSTKTTKIKLNI